MQRLRLTRSQPEFWIDVRLREYEGRWLPVAHLVGELAASVEAESGWLTGALTGCR